jgi:hypothetical protein
MLAWGNNFMWLSDFFLDHVPLYNKFRTVEMTLVIACFNIPLLAFVVVDRIRKEPEWFSSNRQQILVAFGLTGGLSLIFALIPGIFSFFSDYEQQVFQQQLSGANAQYAGQFRQFMDELEAARIYIFRHDAFRSFIFISLAFLLTWFYANKKVKLTWFLAGLALLITVDMWLVDRRYLNKDNFVSERQSEALMTATEADKAILADPDIHYRVANLTMSPWQEAITSYHHKSIGGYHAAKLQRYQDLIEGYLSPSLQDIIGALNANPTPQIMDSVLAAQQVFNMFNTKYLILNKAGQPLRNRAAMGHAWIASDYLLVDGPDAEFAALASTDLRTTAVVDRRFEALLSPGLKKDSVPSGRVQLTEYRPNIMTYSSRLEEASLVVFSDVYYEGGWHATIDGEAVEHLRANYHLRALPVPAGEHEIRFEFVFEPYEKGERISLAGSLLVILILLGSLGFAVRGTVRKPD